MGLLAFVFPGQGAQAPGMGQALYQQSRAARAVFEAAEGLMPGLMDTCFAGPMDTLTQTQWAQPAMFTASLASAAAAEEAGITAGAAAGFSLGEWTAIVFAGMLPFEQAFGLVRRRGEWMARCAAERPGGMAAVLRQSADEVQKQLQAFPEVQAVNFNAPYQTVVAGEAAALDAFLSHLAGQGIRFIRLKVAGAFHSPSMRQASQHLREALAQERFSAPRIPVYSNLTAQPYTLDLARDTLARQAAEPVLWVASVRAMAAAGVDTFLELGPGKVLSGLIGKILPEARVYQAEDPAGIQAAADEIKGKA